MTSCTSALHLSLAALDFKPGDEAIVPAFTWISTANVVEHLGGKVVFCDIDLDTFNIDVNQIDSKSIQRQKLYYLCISLGCLRIWILSSRLQKKEKLAVIEDAACGFGSFYKGSHVGTFGDTGCFSFHPRKAITTGEGGMITTSSNELSQKLSRLRDHGASASDLQRHKGSRPYLLADHPDAGFNQRMTDIQAALGSKQMDRAELIVEERKKIAENYDNNLSNLDWLSIPNAPEGFIHGYQSYPCMFSPEEITLENVSELNDQRNYMMMQLQEKGISTRPATHAVHMLDFYKKICH